MKVAALAGVIAVLGGPVHALSCAQADAVASFQMAAASSDNFLILHGQLTFDPSGLVANGPADPAPIAATFEGDWLSPDGFTSTAPLPLTLQQVCAASWCGSAQPNLPYLMFAQQTGESWTLSLNPCPGLLFQNPDAATLAAMEACIKGQDCTPAFR